MSAHAQSAELAQRRVRGRGLPRAPHVPGMASFTLNEPNARMNSARVSGPMMGATNWKSGASSFSGSQPALVPNSEASTSLVSAMSLSAFSGKLERASIAGTSSSPSKGLPLA